MWLFSANRPGHGGRLSVLKTPPDRQIYYVLRIASAMCFIGHGIFGILTKPIWCHYFAVFGIDNATAYKLMPIVGTVDVLMGLLILIYPMRGIFFWLVIWGFITAALRPLSGEPFAECIERAGNYGAPFCLLLLTAGSRLAAGGWFAPITTPSQTNNPIQINWALRIFAAALLIGHGWLNLINKPGLIDQYLHLGFGQPARIAEIVAIWEIAGAILILIKPAPILVLILLIWKMSSELFYPHHELLEWVERGGSYGVLLALYFSEIMLSRRWSRL